jgi:hypothetical protein
VSNVSFAPASKAATPEPLSVLTNCLLTVNVVSVNALLSVVFNVLTSLLGSLNTNELSPAL